ncbi:hypothetical protein BH11PSE4_BH11PSE4_32250 [soil metagenome]
MAGFISAIRATLTEMVGGDDSAPPLLPAGLPEAVVPAVRDGVALLIAYQGPGYAQLYCDRLRRFVGRRDVDDAMFCEIARLMAMRMSYQDPIRIAQLKLAEPTRLSRPPVVDTRRFRADEIVSALPEIAGDPLMWVLECIGCSHRTLTMRFSTATWWSTRRLMIESSLRRWRLLSVRYAGERVWVERWLHMIDRALTKRPDAAAAIVQSATMIQGYGTGYRHGLSAWHQIIDGLAKPCFDGVLNLPDLTAAIAQARAAPHDPKGDQLRKVIAELRDTGQAKAA